MPSDWFRISSLRDAPEDAGVYVFFSHGAPIYVGQSLRVLERLRSHKLTFTGGSVYVDGVLVSEGSVKVKRSRKFGQWLMDEARLIKRLSPVFNVRNFSRVDYRPDTKRSQYEIPEFGSHWPGTSPVDTTSPYTSVEVSRQWNLSEYQIRSLFNREPGVVAFGERMLISRSALARVHQRLSVQEPPTAIPSAGAAKC